MQLLYVKGVEREWISLTARSRSSPAFPAPARIRADPMSLPFLSADIALAMVAQATCGLFLCDGQDVVYANATACELLGLTIQQDGAPLALGSIMTAGSMPHFEVQRQRVLSGEEGALFASVIALHADGGMLELEAQLSRVGVGEAGYLMVVLRSAAHPGTTTQALSRLAFHDSLTGLPNRALFLDRLNQALRWAKRHRSAFALLCVDLDGFKDINDSSGHDVGDATLREVADLLRNIVRESDTVARLGGDEFAIILNEVEGCTTTLEVAGHVHQALSGGLRIGDTHVALGASIGIAAWPEHGSDMHALMVAADMAMYDAKRQRKGTSRYMPGIGASSSGLSPLMLNWTRDLESGVADIDNEHRGLLDGINRMVAAFSSAEEVSTIQALLDHFIQIASVHFRNEERCMHVLSEEAREQHLREHQRALSELKRLYAAIEVSGVSQTLQFVSDWLFEHIRHNDRQLCSALLQAGTT